MKNKLTRGVKNNNPLNIKIGPARWLGKLPAPGMPLCDAVPQDYRTERVFEQFTACRVPVEEIIERLHDQDDQQQPAPTTLSSKVWDTFEENSRAARVWGYRAAIRTLRTYFRTMHITWPTAIISRWAGLYPDDELDQQELNNYLACVLPLTGFGGEQRLRWTAQDICPLVAAMAKMESAIPYGSDDDLILQAWQLQDVTEERLYN